MTEAFLEWSVDMDEGRWSVFMAEAYASKNGTDLRFSSGEVVDCNDKSR